MALERVMSTSKGTPIHVFTGLFDLAEVAISTTQMTQQEVTATGLLATDIPISFTVNQTGFVLDIANYFVSAANTLTVVLANDDNATVDPADTVAFQLTVIRP